MRKGVIITAALLGLGSLADAGELRTAEELRALCAHSEAPTSPFSTDSAPAAWTAAQAPSTSDYALTSARDPSASPVTSTTAGSSDLLLAGVAARRETERRASLLMQEYSVVLPSSGFRLQGYDEQLGLVRVNLQEQLTILGGRATLNLQEEHQLYFELGQELLEQLETQHALDGLTLRLSIQLSSRAEPERPYCSLGERGELVVEALLLEARLEDRTGHLVHARAATRHHEQWVCRREALRAGTGPIPTPVVRATSLEASGDRPLSEREAALLQLLVETELSACHIRATASNEALRGVLVVGFQLTGDGRIEEAGLLIDALYSAELARCALSTLSRARLPREGGAPPMAVRMNLVFTRDGLTPR